MISPLDVIHSVLPIYLLILSGAILRRLNIIQPSFDEGIMRVVYSVMLPAFMIDKILGSPVLKSSSVIASSIILGFSLILICVACSAALGRILGLERGSGLRTFALSAGSQNFGFTAAPVVQILWPTATLSVLFIHNIGVELAMWSVGVMIMAGSNGIIWKKLLNGPVFAVCFSLTLIACGWDHLLDGPIRSTISMIGVGAFPLAILITGCTIMDLMTAKKPNLKIILGASAIRLFIAPAVFLSAAYFLPLSPELKQVLVVQAAMPAAMTPIMLARLYGGQPAIAVQVVVFTTALSLISLPIIIALGCKWLNLLPILP